MRIKCNNCECKYKVSEDKIVGGNFEFRCRTCGYVIHLDGSTVSTRELTATITRPRLSLAEHFTESFSGGGEVRAYPRLFVSVKAKENESNKGCLPISVLVPIDNKPWYAMIENEKKGPMNASELAKAYLSRSVDGDIMVWKKGMSTWIPLDSCKSLIGLIELLERNGLEDDDGHMSAMECESTFSSCLAAMVRLVVAIPLIIGQKMKRMAGFRGRWMEKWLSPIRFVQFLSSRSKSVCRAQSSDLSEDDSLADTQVMNHFFSATKYNVRDSIRELRPDELVEERKNLEPPERQVDQAEINTLTIPEAKKVNSFLSFGGLKPVENVKEVRTAVGESKGNAGENKSLYPDVFGKKRTGQINARTTHHRSERGPGLPLLPSSSSNRKCQTVVPESSKPKKNVSFSGLPRSSLSKKGVSSTVVEDGSSKKKRLSLSVVAESPLPKKNVSSSVLSRKSLPKTGVSSTIFPNISMQQKSPRPVAVQKKENKESLFDSNDMLHLSFPTEEIDLKAQLIEDLTSEDSSANDIVIEQDEKKMIRAFEEIQEMYSLQEHDDAAAYALCLARRVIECEAGRCLFLAPGRSYLYVAACEGSTGLDDPDIRISPYEGVIGHAVRTERAVIISDKADDKRYDPIFDDKQNFETRNMICTALFSRGRMLGIIELYNAGAEEGFTQYDGEILTYIAKTLGEFADISLPERDNYFKDELVLKVENA